MPHIRIEYSENVYEKGTIKDLFLIIHHMLSEELPTRLQSCKSRAIGYETYYLGDNRGPNTFMHLELKTTKGKSKETLNKVGEHLMLLLQKHFAKSLEELHLEISVEIMELNDTYFSPWMKYLKTQAS